MSSSNIVVPRVAHPQDGFSSTKQSGEAHKPRVDLVNVPSRAVPYFTPEQDPPAGAAHDPQPDGKPIPKLFQPLKIRGMTVQNRIWLSPLCQYSAQEGFHSAWHLTHLGGIAQRGPGITFVEATAVQANGRITPEDSGLWLDAHIAGLKPTVDFVHSQNQKIAIQIGHAGRKASTVAPWLSFGGTAAAENGGWPDDCVSASDLPYSDTFPKPRALTLAEIDALKHDFVAATKRSLAAGFDAVEIHAAHGYLLHQFLSPATNKRTDAYGGSFENRTRLLLEITEAVRKVLPDDYPLFARISATDWLEEVDGFGPDKSWTLAQSVELAKLLADRGVDVLDVSSAGNHPQQKIKGGPAYQAPFSKAIKKAVGDRMLVTAVGSITEGNEANALVTGGKDADDEPLDAVFAGKPFQKNPGLVWAWADDLGVAIHLANQIAWPVAGRGSKRQPAKKD